MHHVQRRLIATSAWLAGTLPFLVQLTSGRTSRDVEHYLASAQAVFAGAGIYTSVPFEYPPYALAWFLGPAAAVTDLSEFRARLGFLMWGMDAAVKAVLIWYGCRRRDKGIDLVPFLAYTLATAALTRILLQRYDLIPAALSFAAVVMLARGWPLVAGVLVAGAAGTKLFPALYFPVMVAFAWRQSPRSASRLVAGGVIGSLPLLALSLSVPWWNFLAFHANRGLEAGSLWASTTWLAHYVAEVPAQWEVVSSSWVEVSGPVASWLLTPARTVWVLATLAALGIAVWAAWCGSRMSTPTDVDVADDGGLARLSVLVLAPVTAFVAFNPVLSPQFHLWIAPWCALALLGRSHRQLLTGSAGVRRALTCLLVANCLVPIFYPSRTFTPGLDFGRTIVLVLRDLLLVYAAWTLASAIRRFYRVPAPSAVSRADGSTEPRRNSAFVSE